MYGSYIPLHWNITHSQSMRLMTYLFHESCNCTNTCTHSLSSPLLQPFAFCVSVPISLLFHFTNKEILGPEFYIVICAGRFRLGSKLVVHNNRLIWSLSHGQPNIQVRAGKGPVGLCESNKPDAQMILLTVRRGHLLSLHVTAHIWVILLKTGQNCDIEGNNSECEFFDAVIWK